MAKTQSARFEIEKFNGKNNFEIWKGEDVQSACATRRGEGIDGKIQTALQHDR